MDSEAETGGNLDDLLKEPEAEYVPDPCAENNQGDTVLADTREMPEDDYAASDQDMSDAPDEISEVELADVDDMPEDIEEQDEPDSADADDMPEDVVKDQGELVNIEDVVEDSNPGPSKFIPVNVPEEPAVHPDNTPSKRKADPTPGASKAKRTKTSKPVAKASSRPVTKAMPQKVKASGKQSSKIKSDEMVYDSEEDDVLKAINMIKSKSIGPKPSQSSISSTNSTGTTNTATVKATPAKNSASPAPVKKVTATAKKSATPATVKKTLPANIDNAPLVANDEISL